jgi:AcrR family transcriptional regulator
MARPKATENRETRQLALDAVARLIQQHGYNGVSMSTLAEASGVRKATLYHHFPDGKEALVAEMLEGMIRQHGQGYDAAIAKGKTVKSKLEHILAFALKESSAVNHVMSDSLRFIAKDKEAQLGQLFITNQYLKIRRVIEEGITTGELRKHDATLSTWMFLSLMGELGALEDHVSKTTFPRDVVNLFLKGLL